MRARALGVSAFLYVMVTAVLGRHVLAQPGTTIANDPGDPLLTAALLHWNASRVPLSDAWWQFPIFHPTADALAFSEHLLGLSVIASPIAWLSGNPLFTYNITLLLTFPLAALAMYALVHRLASADDGGDRVAVSAGAFVAGLAYAFAPYRISNLPHIQMLASFWAPVALLGLHAYLSTRRRRWLVLFGAAWLLQAASNFYALVFLSFLVGLWALWFIAAQRQWHALGGIAAATGVAALPLGPILYRYVSVHTLHGFERSLGEVRTYSADLAATLCAPSALSIWGWIRVSCRAEGELFPGVSIVALCIAATWWLVRQAGVRARQPAAAQRTLIVVQRGLLLIVLLFAVVVATIAVAGPWSLAIGPARVSASEIDKPLLVAVAAGALALLIALGQCAFRGVPAARVSAFYAFAAIVTWTLTLGPTVTFLGELSGRPGPFAVLQDLPGFGGLRVPARFWMMTTLCLAVVAGLFVTRLLRARPASPARAPLLAGVVIAVLADGWAAPIPAQAPPDGVPEPAALKGGVVLQLPVDPFPDIAATWRAATGGWRAVNGYSGYAPNYYAALRTAAVTADPAMFLPFRRAGDLHVVVADDAPALHDLVQRQDGAMLTGRRQGMTQFRLPRRAHVPASALGGPHRIAGARSTCAAGEARAVFDRDRRSHWECAQDADGSVLTLDLGGSRLVGGIVYSQGAYSWIVPAAIVIETSEDAQVWTLARDGSVLGEMIAGGLRDPASLEAELRFPPREARYLRLRAVAPPGDFTWYVAELEVRAPF